MIRADDSRRLESRSIWTRQSNERSTNRTKKGRLSTTMGSSGSRPAPSTGRSGALHEDYISSTHVSGGRDHKRIDDAESPTSQTKILKQTEIWVGSA